MCFRRPEFQQLPLHGLAYILQVRWLRKLCTYRDDFLLQCLYGCLSVKSIVDCSCLVVLTKQSWLFSLLLYWKHCWLILFVNCWSKQFDKAYNFRNQKYQLILCMDIPKQTDGNRAPADLQVSFSFVFCLLDTFASKVWHVQHWCKPSFTSHLARY